MYTFWKRTSPPPDSRHLRRPRPREPAPSGGADEHAAAGVDPLNDPTYVEASRKLAERIMTDPEAGSTAESRLTFAFRVATARVPSASELAVLGKVFDSQLNGYKNNPTAVEKLLTVGESPRNQELDQPRLAAWTMLCSTLLNLDETVTRN